MLFVGGGVRGLLWSGGIGLRKGLLFGIAGSAFRRERIRVSHKMKNLKLIKEITMMCGKAGIEKGHQKHWCVDCKLYDVCKNPNSESYSSCFIGRNCKWKPEKENFEVKNGRCYTIIKL